MEDILSFIARLADDGVHLRLEGDQLRYRAPSGLVTSRYLESIRKRKDEIVATLRTRSEGAGTAIAGSSGDPAEPQPLAQLQRVFVDSYDRVQAPIQQHSMVAQRLLGPVDASILQKSVAALTARHAVLRSRYVRSAEGDWSAVVVPSVSPWFQTLRLQNGDTTSREEQARALIARLRAPRFDLLKGPLLRVSLISLSDTDHVLLMVVHHSVSDGWSLRLMLRDTYRFYAAFLRNESPRLPPLTCQYYDHVRWRAAWLESPAGQAQRRYWRERLEGVKQAFWLPQDRIENPAEVIRQDPFVVTSDALRALREVARREKTTLAVVVLTAFAVALSRWSGLTDIVIAVLHLGRSRPHLLELIGCFVDAWVLRVSTADRPCFVQLLRRVRSTGIEAQENIHVPFYEMKQHLAAGSDENPLRHIAFNYLSGMEIPAEEARVGDLVVQEFATNQPIEPMDEGRGDKLVVYFTERENALVGALRYSPRRFGEATIDAFWRQMRALLETTAVEAPASKEPL